MKGGVACWISAVSSFIKNKNLKDLFQLLFQLMKKQQVMDVQLL